MLKEPQTTRAGDQGDRGFTPCNFPQASSTVLSYEWKRGKTKSRRRPNPLLPARALKGPAALPHCSCPSPVTTIMAVPTFPGSPERAGLPAASGGQLPAPALKSHLPQELAQRSDGPRAQGPRVEGRERKSSVSTAAQAWTAAGTDLSKFSMRDFHYPRNSAVCAAAPGTGQLRGVSRGSTALASRPLAGGSTVSSSGTDSLTAEALHSKGDGAPSRRLQRPTRRRAGSEWCTGRRPRRTVGHGPRSSAASFPPPPPRSQSPPCIGPPKPLVRTADRQVWSRGGPRPVAPHCCTLCVSLECAPSHRPSGTSLALQGE